MVSPVELISLWGSKMADVALGLSWAVTANTLLDGSPPLDLIFCPGMSLSLHLAISFGPGSRSSSPRRVPPLLSAPVQASPSRPLPRQTSSPASDTGRGTMTSTSPNTGPSANREASTGRSLVSAISSLSPPPRGADID